MFPYTDSHFHALHMEKKGFDPAGTLRELAGRGFIGGIEVGTHPADIRIRRELLAGIDGIYLAGGIHPSSIQHEKAEELLAQIKLITDAAKGGIIQAVGECGIDLYRSPETLKEQQKLFITQLEAADGLNLPVIIHNRDADRYIAEILKAHRPACGGIMHCFSSSLPFAQSMQELGFYISFAGNLTYRKSQGLQKVLKGVRPDRLLFETDSPFLSPVPYRGRPNHPGNIVSTYQFAAELLGMEASALADQTASNLRTLLNQRP